MALAPASRSATAHLMFPLAEAQCSGTRSWSGSRAFGSAPSASTALSCCGWLSAACVESGLRRRGGVRGESSAVGQAVGRGELQRGRTLMRARSGCPVWRSCGRPGTTTCSWKRSSLVTGRWGFLATSTTASAGMSREQPYREGPVRIGRKRTHWSQNDAAGCALSPCSIQKVITVPFAVYESNRGNCHHVQGEHPSMCLAAGNRPEAPLRSSVADASCPWCH